MGNEERVVLEIVAGDLCVKESNCSSLDWVRITEILLEKKLFLFLYPQIRTHIEGGQEGCFDTIYKRFCRRIDRQIYEIKNIQDKFNKKGIRVMFVKGIPLSQVVYNNLYVRQSNDIDILVDKEDMICAYNGIYELGYRFMAGRDKRNERPVLIDKPDFLFREDHHEFPCLKQDENGNYVKIEIKYATSAIPYKHIKDFQMNFQEVDIGGISIKTFNIHYTLLHIIAHLYVNTQSEDCYLEEVILRDFVDLKIFLKQHSDIDWNFIFEKSNKYEILHEVYFALNSINSLWTNTIDTEIVDLFKPSKITYNYNGNEYGEEYTWKSDIATRCFSREVRLKEYSFLYKTDIFSKTDIPEITDNGTAHSFVVEKEDIRYQIFISYDRVNKRIRLVTLFDLEFFKNNDLYFFISLVDNDVSKELRSQNMSLLKEMHCTNLEGRWEAYEYQKQGINFINIEVEGIFTKKCDRVYLLVDTFKNIGDVGFRGTGVKGEFIIYNVMDNIEDEHMEEFEEFDVYNSNGTKIGKTEYRKNQLLDGDFRLGIHAYICNFQQNFLIQKRSMQKDILPGIWDVHMGHAITGEESYDALFREIQEELGIFLNPANICSMKRFVWHETKYLLDIFFIVSDIKVSDCTLQKSELDAIKYIDLEAMMCLIEKMNRPAEYKRLVHEGIEKLQRFA